MKLAANLLERAYRGARIGYTAACVYLRIKLPRWWDRLLRRAPEDRDMTRIHQRNADQIFRTATQLKGLLINGILCQNRVEVHFVYALCKKTSKAPLGDAFGQVFDGLFSLVIGEVDIAFGLSKILACLFVLFSVDSL